ncbi:sodium/glutamate symporter [Francisellaceae bacterium]|nr:sodium/glutamate symporter [Francisellaceae bacterium]
MTPIYFDLGINGTLIAAVLVLLTGRFLQHKIAILEKFFIPAPVIGGVIFSIIITILAEVNILHLTFHNNLQTLLMIAFFATVGFSAGIKFLIKGGKAVVLFLILATVLVIFQNVLGISLANLLGQDSVFGVALSSIPMTGGHGTSAAFGPLLENDFLLNNASTITIAAATFGLISGSLIGGPVAKRLVKKHNLKPDKEILEDAHIDTDHTRASKIKISETGVFSAIVVIAFAVTIGSIITYWLNAYELVFPVYIGAMFAAAIIRNISDFSGWFEIKDNEIHMIGEICLSLFLSMALMRMNLVSLLDLALPIFIILIAQVLLVILFTYFITFRVMGKDYDAAVMACGQCGFALGATPNAMANMEAFTAKNFPSPKSFFVIPIVGSLFIDFVNSGVITGTLNFLQ